MTYKYPICDVFHWFCKIARFFATEPNILRKTKVIYLFKYKSPELDSETIYII